MKKSSCIRKCNIDCSNPDYGKIEEVLEELEQTISSLDDKEKNKCNIAFYKKGRCIQFEDCSSGEKHMIFAFTGVLSSIEPKSVILIDEPEISLHPEWQIQYVVIRIIWCQIWKVLHHLLFHLERVRWMRIQ